MDEMNNTALINAAMGILTYAGDARVHAKKALQAVQVFDFILAQNELGEASKNINEAHKAQTEIIQNEARGTKYEYCMLFNHAQDTLMTINSEIELVKELVKTFEVFAKAMRTEVKA